MADFTAAYGRVRRPTVEHPLYETEVLLPRVERELQAFAAQAQEPPDAVATWIHKNGGGPKHISDEAEQMIVVAEELRQARFRAELADATPSQVRDLFVRDIERMDDAAQTRARYIERRYRGGWPGAPVATDDQRAAAVDLQKAIQRTREARVLVEVGLTQTAIHEGRLRLARAQNKNWTAFAR